CRRHAARRRPAAAPAPRRARRDGRTRLPQRPACAPGRSLRIRGASVMTSVRLAAARALLAIDSREGTLGSVLDEARRPGADPRDAGLLTELTAGVLRWRNELDAVIAAAGRRSVRGIDAPVLAVLRVGAYQLRHLDRVPDHAVVHESVEAVRALGAASAAGFVNAVLRAIIRRGPAIALPPRPTSGRIDAQVNYLSITLSHPAWLVRRWIERLGFDAAEAWCRVNNTVARSEERRGGTGGRTTGA